MILLQSGAKSRDFLHLNRLGICMSHTETIKKQKEMGKSHNAFALMWKREIEANKRCELFLREIKSKQVPVFEDNDMALDVIIDTSESLLSSYRYYFKKVYDIRMAALRKDFAENDAFTDEFLQLKPVPNTFDIGNFMSSSPIFAKVIPHRFELTQVMHQSNQEFLSAVSELRVGKCSAKTQEFFSSLNRQLPPEVESDVTHIFFSERKCHVVQPAKNR